MASYVQHPVTHKLVPVEEVDWPRERRRLAHPSIMPDIEPFVSPVDGSLISSRSSLRDHNKRNDVVNVREFDGVVEAKAKERRAIAEGTHAPTKKDRIKDIVKAVNKVEQGYKPEVLNEHT